MALRAHIQHPSEALDENDLQNSIQARLYGNEVLRQSKAAIRVQLMGGTALLSGNVQTDTHVDLAKSLVSRIAGIKQVRSELITDTSIENAVALKLALDPAVRLTTDQVTVSSLLGSVLLSGKVESEAKKEAALAALETVRGVWEIVDALDVSALAGRRAGMGAAAVVADVPAAAEHGASLDFTPEWPRKTAKGKAATPLSAAARARIGM